MASLVPEAATFTKHPKVKVTLMRCATDCKAIAMCEVQMYMVVKKSFRLVLTHYINSPRESAIWSVCPEHPSIWLADCMHCKKMHLTAPHAALLAKQILFPFILQYQYKFNLFFSTKWLFAQLTLIYYSHTLWLERVCARGHT